MNKIEALRLSAKAIRQGHFYNWRKPHTCNCGIVAQTIMGKDTPDMALLMDKTIALARSVEVKSISWTAMSSALCPITGIPIDTVFKALYEAGFDRTDICNLEHLEDAEICRRAGIVQRNGKEEVMETKWSWFIRKKVVKEAAVKAHFEFAKNAAAYMEAWADMLEEGEIEPQLKEAADRLMAKTE